MLDLTHTSVGQEHAFTEPRLFANERRAHAVRPRTSILGALVAPDSDPVHQPRRAASIAAMSIFLIVIIASKVRFA
jgi:hypothetical protein